MIPFVDLAGQSSNLRDELMEAIAEVVDESYYILGRQVESFEQAFAEYTGAAHCVGMANGTEALHLTLRALGVGPGDEVITVANTFVATALAITYAGATPVLVDCSPDDYTLDVEYLEEAITPRTKAILPVHLYGQPADMRAILEIADKHGLPVVQDACQAHGALVAGQPLGALAEAACYSFYPSKNLGALGDGGAVVTNSAQLAGRLRRLRNYGQESKNVYTMLGFNCRLDTMQAAMLEVKLRHLDRWNVQRRAAAGKYNELLHETDLVLPSERPGTRHVYHLYVVRHARRDELAAHLQQAGVQCGIHYPDPLHLTGPFQSARTVPDGAPVSTRLSREIISLPMFPEIRDDQLQQVADAVMAFASEVATA
jgi:dTDP-4-amino-4,6-dideoxygalactose transaminase